MDTFRERCPGGKISLQRFAIEIQDWLVALVSSFHDLMCLNWQLYFLEFSNGRQHFHNRGKGTDTSPVWKSTCFLRASCLNCKLMFMREVGQVVSGWKKGVLVHRSDHTHLIEKQSRFWLPLANSPDEMTCGFSINCCCLWLLWFKREAACVFHHINSNETHDEVPCSFPDQLHFHPDSVVGEPHLT